MHTVVMPKLSDTMEEGKILSWLKQEGDQVAKGDSLAEIETEKVNIEVEAFSAGVLRKILVPAGSSAPVGSPIALIGAASEQIPAEFAAAATPKKWQNWQCRSPPRLQRRASRCPPTARPTPHQGSRASRPQPAMAGARTAAPLGLQQRQRPQPGEQRSRDSLR